MGKSIIILHGWRSRASKWDEVKKILEKENFSVFVPELPGLNKEPLTKPLTLDDYINFAINFLEKNKIEKAIFIGHSFGGRIAVKIAIKFPEKIEKLIIIGSPLLRINKLKTSFYLLIAKIGKFFFSIPPLVCFYPVARKMIYRLAGSSDYLMVYGPLKKTLQNVVGEDLKKYLPDISQKTLVVWGEKDRIVPMKIGKMIKRMIPKSDLLIIPNGNHTFPYDFPQKFTLLIIKFLKSK